MESCESCKLCVMRDSLTDDAPNEFEIDLMNRSCGNCGVRLGNHNRMHPHGRAGYSGDAPCVRYDKAWLQASI